MNPPQILIIEDDDLQYEIYEDALARYELIRVANCSEALDQIARRTIIRDLQELIRRGQLKPEVYPEWDDARGCASEGEDGGV